MDHKLDELVQKLKYAAGQDLRAIVLYGSAVTGEFHSKHSNLNMLCLIERTSAVVLDALRPVVFWWIRQGHPAPLIFTLDELRRSADVFAIELLDMKAHHRMLFGEDFFPELSVPLQYHRAQVERELRTGWLRLRQAIVVSPKKAKVLLGLMVSSVSSFAALFRHALLALGEPPAATKREAIDQAARLAGSDPRGFQTILDLREGKRKANTINVEQTLGLYFALVEAVTNEVDRRLDAKS
ncbi:MAG: hypothetical protein WBC04_12895 [Candidatus Acidiferrales bacterium]